MKEDNLRPIKKGELSKEEAMKRGRNGGIKSGEARREKKLMKDQISLLLSLPLKDKEEQEQLKKIGINSDNIDNQMAMIIKMWQVALQGGKNSVGAATFLRDTIGEKPIDKIEASANISYEQAIKEVVDEDEY